jgi:hypothetical protein
VSEAFPSRCAGGAISSESGDFQPPAQPTWLGLTAAPAFAIAALLTGVPGGAQPDIRGQAAEHASQLGGMTPMYSRGSR